MLTPRREFVFGVWSEIVGRPLTDDPLVRQPSWKEVRVRLTVELQTTDARKAIKLCEPLNLFRMKL
jgi:hypothetical protein